MRILMVQPDYRSGGASFRLVAKPEPLALELLAATIPEQEVRILDLRINTHLDGMLRSFKPDVVGVTALTCEVYAARETLQ
jgi:hypothetical protein